jgi:hypothetical protein
MFKVDDVVIIDEKFLTTLYEGKVMSISECGDYITVMTDYGEFEILKYRARLKEESDA